ncbi:MAG: TerB family tellurite resistance protein [Nitrospinae bacterium]|nr:TerB family tellurite resistance protein [Nitrospinota bacterium]
MLARLLSLLDGAKEGREEESRLPTLTAALLLEIARCDDAFGEGERTAIVDAVAARFRFDRREAEGALEDASRRRERATDFWEITTEANRRLSVEEKIAVVETAWKVIDADGKVSVHEDALIRRLASLLRVTHTEMIAAKKRARGV